MTTKMMTHQVDDEMVLIPQYNYCPAPALHTHIAPPDHQGKPRQRKRKCKGGENRSGLRKRKLNEEQVNRLEESFGNEHKLESERKDRLASELGLDPRQVAIWFQNRRARWKSKNLEEEYSKLKSQHDSNLIHKCRLETQVLQLKEQLSQAEKEIQRLLERADGTGSSSPSSTFSMELMQPPFFGDFAMYGLENLFYIPENNYVQGFEWVNNMYI